MSKTDPVADCLTRIRNAVKAHHKKVDIPASNLKREIIRILYENKFIQHYINIDDGKQNIIRIYLKYDSNNQSVITKLKRISTPGCRMYVGVDKIPRVLNNLGIAIISTSRGVMTNKQAKKLGIGGEVMCHVW